MKPTSDDRHLGEYRLKELIRESDLTRTWLAEQVPVARQVLVDELRPEQADQREAFLADIRAKAAVEHPLVGSVYEAVSTPEQCFFVDCLSARRRLLPECGHILQVNGHFSGRITSN